MKIYNDFWGWGTIVGQTDEELIVRFDSDPWNYPAVSRSE